MIGIVADDMTGANDIGGMFAKNGYSVEALIDTSARPLPDADVVIVNTNSRPDLPVAAARKVTDACRLLASANPALLMKKTCSALRGNIGAEFDATLDAWGANFAVVVAAFPKNGRTTIHGEHFVHGHPLSESQFATDPLHPMWLNGVREIISRQSKRPVHLVDIGVVKKGSVAVRQAVEGLRKRGGYAVCDCGSQDDLRVLADASSQERLIFGSSAIAEELPAFLPGPAVHAVSADLPPKGPALLISGSVTPQTAGQIEVLCREGVGVMGIDPVSLLRPESRAAEITKLTEWSCRLLESGASALVYSPGDPELIATTMGAAREAGIAHTDAGRIITTSLAALARDVVQRTGTKRLIVAGGETSGDVCAALGITGNRILEEIEPGVPLSLSRGSHELLMVLKAGGFGSPGFLRKALTRMESGE